ncbi:hypothetical protein O181_014515 [Austropuccinia psidii MF-1]|uniref:Uncharacterized protein n=1 Tax=Austropuccinia psidii MF-1 TaxID=1389203 RepID=A0A9Q3C137_9BASI|nr:hypothetical protein [Austropuccinia psidii MF-1]
METYLASTGLLHRRNCIYLTPPVFNVPLLLPTPTHINVCFQLLLDLIVQSNLIPTFTPNPLQRQKLTPLHRTNLITSLFFLISTGPYKRKDHGPPKTHQSTSLCDQLPNQKQYLCAKVSCIFKQYKLGTRAKP